MNEMILAGLPKEYRQLAVRAAQGDDYQTILAALTERLEQAAGDGPKWKANIEKVRGELRSQEHALGVPESNLPDKLAHSHNQRQRAFYADAIARLSTLIEPG